MIKMDMIWIAAAMLIYPDTSSRKLITARQIENQVLSFFNTQITPIMIIKHLVSWEDRDADRSNPSRGGSRNRYLFRSINGTQPSREGKFRLYKSNDLQFDGWDKTGRICPEIDSIPEELRYLFKWYYSCYFAND